MATSELVTAIDPGKTSGWAQFVEGRLTLAGTFTDRSYPAAWGGERRAHTLVIEVPRIYPGNSKGDPNDIIELALTVGETIGHYRHKPNVSVVTTYPRTWKGQVPKEIHHVRVLRQLDHAELAIIEPMRKRVTKTNPNGFDHNMLDAIGLGLWFLKRNNPPSEAIGDEPV